jgi:hypothetical protein
MNYEQAEAGPSWHEHEPAAGGALNRLDAELERLSSLVDLLAHRIAPVMRTDMLEKVADTVPAPSTDLQKQLSRLEDLNRTLSSLVDRIDL